MSSLLGLKKSELIDLLKTEKDKYDEFCKLGLHLDMSRGNPSKEQLSLNGDLLMVSGKHGSCFLRLSRHQQIISLLGAVPH